MALRGATRAQPGAGGAEGPPKMKPLFYPQQLTPAACPPLPQLGAARGFCTVKGGGKGAHIKGSGTIQQCKTMANRRLKYHFFRQQMSK